MADGLRVSTQLTLPAEAVTQTFAIFGKRGSGKSNTGVVLAEEMYKLGAPFVVLDPIGAWWGLKSSFDGKGAGLAVYIFGGQHGDLPLEPTAGLLIADVFIQHRIPMVLDMKGWTGADRARFVTDFALRLLGANDRHPVHVFIEEADAFVPQRPYKGEERMLGAMDRLVRWGRQEGIGATLITQRSAKVNKDVTTQAETLIAHRTVGPQDRDAIDSWIKFHAGGEERQEVLSSLPTIPDGTAWVWSPEWLGFLRQVPFRRRETFDSASNPKMGEKRVQPKELAAVDVDRLRDQLATTIEKAKADDPRELRKRIVQLERELAAERKRTSSIEVREVEKVVEVGVVPPDLAEIASQLQTLAMRLGARPATRQVARQTKADLPPPPKGAPIAFLASGSQQRILDTLAWLEAVGLSPANRSQVAFLAGYTPNSGGFNNYLGAMRSGGLIEYPTSGYVGLTAAGRTTANPPAAPATTEELQGAIYAKLGASKARILQALIHAYPGSLSREELAGQVGYTANSGGFNNYLGSMRSLGLIDYPTKGSVAAQPVLFLEGRK